MRKRSVAEIKQLIGSGPTPQPPLAGHHIFHYLRLVEALGASPEPLKPLVAVSPEEQREFARKYQIPPKGVCGLIPGAEYGSAKRWPWESFAEAVLQVQRQTPRHWLIFGGKGDSSLAEQISGKIRGKFPGTVTDLTGRTTLRELMAGLGHCQAVLTNDTGPMHVAAALNTPVVAIFGSTSPELTAPGLPANFPGILLQKRPPCAPCFLRECPIDLRCLRQILPADAAEAVGKLIHRS